MSVSETKGEKRGDGVRKNLILYIPLINEFYTVCMHFLFKKIKLQKAGVEIFNSRQNRIQYEKHYETNVIFKNC